VADVNVGAQQTAVLEPFEGQPAGGRFSGSRSGAPAPPREQRRRPHSTISFLRRSAIGWKWQRSGRADRAPGRRRAGEDFAWRQGLPGRFSFKGQESAIPLAVRLLGACPLRSASGRAGSPRGKATLTDQEIVAAIAVQVGVNQRGGSWHAQEHLGGLK